MATKRTASVEEIKIEEVGVGTAFKLDDFIKAQPTVSRTRNTGSLYTPYISRKKWVEENAHRLRDTEGKPTAVAMAIDQMLYTGKFYDLSYSEDTVIIEIKPTKLAPASVKSKVLVLDLNTWEGFEYATITIAKQETEKRLMNKGE